MIQAIFFDLDNTLVNTKESGVVAREKTFRFLGDQLNRDWQVLQTNWLQLVKTLKNSKDPAKRQYKYSFTLLLQDYQNTKQLVNQALTIFDEEIMNLLVLTPGTKEFFNQILEFKKIIFTENTKQVVLKKIKNKLPTEKFDKIIGIDDTLTMKPDVKFFSSAWKQFNLDASKCVYIGDNWNKDCQIGQNEGGIGVVFGGKETRANYCIDNMMDLMQIIGKY